jgi:hypothetical protein
MLRGRRSWACCRAASRAHTHGRAQAPPAPPGHRRLARVRADGDARVAVLSWGPTGRYSCNAIRSRLITNRSDWGHARPLPGKSRLRHDWNTLVVRAFRHVWRVLRLKVRTPQQPYGASPDHSRRQLPLGRRQCGVAVLTSWSSWSGARQVQYVWLPLAAPGAGATAHGVQQAPWADTSRAAPPAHRDQGDALSGRSTPVRWCAWQLPV